MSVITKTDNLDQTFFAQNFQERMRTKYLYNVTPRDGQNLLVGVVNTILSYLSAADVRKKSKPMAVEVKDPDGNFLFGAAITYDPSTDKDMPGNWDVTTSFDRADLEALGSNIEWVDFFNNSVLQVNYSTYITNKFGYVIADIKAREILSVEAVKCLVSYLNQNAEEGYRKEVVIPDLLTAIVEVDLATKEKCLGVVLSAVAKQRVKDDITSGADVAEADVDITAKKTNTTISSTTKKSA